MSEEARVAARPRRGILRRPVLAAALLVAALLCGAGAGVAFPLEALFRLAFGWCSFLASVVPRVQVNPEALAMAAACLVGLAWGGHRFAGWAHGAWARAGGEATAAGGWRLRWTASGLALLVLLFASAIATVGIAHQAIWLLRGPILDRDGTGKRGLQKRSMASLRSIGTAVEAYALDHGGPPRVPDGVAEELRLHLEPTYIRQLPLLDGWNRPIHWRRAPGSGHYSLISLGKDGLADERPVAGETTAFASDIYFADGAFTVYPEGPQR